MQRLGTTTDVASAPRDSGVARRYKLQDEAARLLSGERVCMCCKQLAFKDPSDPAAGRFDTVQIEQNSAGRTRTANLMTCDSVWVCPVCSSKISEQRREEIKAAYELSGKFAVLATFTLRHNKQQPLVDTFNQLKTARRAMKSGRWWRTFKHEWRWCGDIRTYEITYGENGWHPHAHVLMFFDEAIDGESLEQLELILAGKWIDELQKLGADATYEHGFDLRSSHSDVAEYISKHGKMPESARGDGWSEPEEMTKSHQKIGKNESKTPWDLLVASLQGDKQSGALFVEYANATKGSSQTQWSRGLKELLNLDELIEQLRDENPGDENPDDDYEVVLEVRGNDWLDICRYKKRSDVLIAVANGDIDEAVRIVQECRVRCLDEIKNIIVGTSDNGTSDRKDSK